MTTLHVPCGTYHEVGHCPTDAGGDNATLAASVAASRAFERRDCERTMATYGTPCACGEH